MDVRKKPEDHKYEFQRQAQPGFRSIKIETFDIHEIGKSNCPVGIGTLQHLIRCQASLHMASTTEDQRKLGDILREQRNLLRGFVLWGEGVGPVGYAIYYPMIDNKGARAAYCEDFFIVESYRGYGVANILFHELAKRSLRDDNLEYVQWATDARNKPVQEFVQKKLGAKHPNILTLTATKLLDPNLTLEWKAKGIRTQRLWPHHVDFLSQFGLGKGLISNTGDMPFKGFITIDESNRSRPRPLAITPGWHHFSTFQLKSGLHLEEPIFAKDVSEEDVLFSIASAARSYAKKEKLPYMRWHISDASIDPTINYVLRDKLHLPLDSMLGTPDSELIVYTLTNGKLSKLADTEPNRTIHIPTNDPIGAPRSKKNLDESANDIHASQIAKSGPRLA